MTETELQISVFRAERDAGIEQEVQSSGRVLLASVAHPVAALPKPARFAITTAGVADFDLFPLTSVLTTTGWNGNDDVFDRHELWSARATPEDKQLNYEHDDSKIIGHITSNWVMDAAENIIDDNMAVDNLPNKFHVVTGAVLYRHWQTPELQKRMDDTIAQIAKGEWFVSMECLFKGFDYALKSASGSIRVVERTEQTSFMTRHLRAYGGTGQYGGQRIGRVLRNIIFSGKGLVRNPANPESVILTPPAQAQAASWEAPAFATAFVPAKQPSRLEADVASYLRR